MQYLKQIKNCISIVTPSGIRAVELYKLRMMMEINLATINPVWTWQQKMSKQEAARLTATLKHANDNTHYPARTPCNTQS